MQTRPQRTFTVTKRLLYSPKDDATYWRTCSYQERLAALEEIRREFHQWKYNAEPRFQRFYTIAQR